MFSGFQTSRAADRPPAAGVPVSPRGRAQVRTVGRKPAALAPAPPSGSIERGVSVSVGPTPLLRDSHVWRELSGSALAAPPGSRAEVLRVS